MTGSYHPCVMCGYDLRGSEDQCPECGTHIPILKQEKVRPRPTVRTEWTALVDDAGLMYMLRVIGWVALGGWMLSVGVGLIYVLITLATE